ncbi:hypothetical protein WT73_27910 [Burkholderia stagnalis]|nr:hypothetical protein WT73_27910 [Burkholderia stagnalis]
MRVGRDAHKLGCDRGRLHWAMVRDVMLQAIGNSFAGVATAEKEIERLSGNGSSCIVDEMLTSSREIVL